MTLRNRSLIAALLWLGGIPVDSLPSRQDLGPNGGVSARQLLENLESGEFSGRRIDLIVSNGSIRKVFTELEHASGLRLALDPAIDDAVTYRMLGVPWDEALAVVLSDHSLHIGPDLAGTGFKIGRGSVIVLGLSDPRRASIVLFLYRRLGWIIAAAVLLVTVVPLGVFARRRYRGRLRVESRRPLLSREEADLVKRRLFRLLEVDRIYRQESATLPLLAERLAVSTHQLPWLLNQELGQTFSSLINGYRVQEVTRRLSDPSSNHMSLLQMGLEAGFSSKASFNRAFKKVTGTTPSQFRKGVSA